MNSKKTYLWGGIGAFFTIVMIVILALEIPHFHFLLDARAFVMRLAFFSIILGFVLAYFIGRKMSNIDRIRLYLIFGFFTFIPVLGLGSWMNRAGGTVNKESVELLSCEARFASAYGIIESDEMKPNQFVVTFRRKGRLHSKVSTKELGTAEKGYPQFVELGFKKGLLGFELIQID